MYYLCIKFEETTNEWCHIVPLSQTRWHNANDLWLTNETAQKRHRRWCVKTFTTKHQTFKYTLPFKISSLSLSLFLFFFSSFISIQISRNSSLRFRVSNLMCWCRLVWVHSRSCSRSLFSTTKRRSTTLASSNEGYYPLKPLLLFVAFSN